jgi:thiamine-phosphate pyrophosphorylase
MAGALMVLTDRRLAGGAGHDLVDVVAAAVDAGASAVLLRERDLPGAERRGLAERLRSIATAAGAELIVASDATLARDVGADGVHLAAADPDVPPGAGLRVGRSCHTIDDLRAAATAGLDYATFSPVFATMSKPGYGPALGIDGLAAGVRVLADAGSRRTGRALPVYALGGIGPAEASACRAAGAAGVAAMGAVMRADDPGGVVRAMMEAMLAGGSDA